MRSINKQLREKSIKTKVNSLNLLLCVLNLYYVCENNAQNFLFLLFSCLCFSFQVGAFSVLKELVVVLPDCLADHIGSLIPGIEKALYVSFFLSLLTPDFYARCYRSLLFIYLFS